VTLLRTAKPVGAASAEHMPELNKFHHGASLDDFYMISTVMDCPPGSILWHKHTFKDLFHDAPQVAYHRFPTYCHNVRLFKNRGGVAPAIDYYKSFEERKDSKGKDTFDLSDWHVSE